MTRVISINPNYDRQVKKVILADGVFKLRVYWVARCTSWFFDVSTEQGELLVGGKRLAVFSPLLLPHKQGEGQPTGTLWLANFRSLAEATHDLSAEDIKLLYVEATA